MHEFLNVTIMDNCDKGFCDLLDLDEKKESRFTQKEIDDILKDMLSKVDYKVGDWVETCNMLPGIVQKIDVCFDKEGDYFHDNVEVFYPHYALDPTRKYACAGEYYGGSCCSSEHCGVHKITPEYACKLMALGEDRLEKLWEKGSKETPEGEYMNWEKLVEDEYERVFGDRMRR